MRAWIYDPVGLNGGAGGEVFRTVFNGSGFDAAELLAREAIQNSVDATREGAKPEVTIEARMLTGDELAVFWNAAALDDLARRADQLELPDGNALESPLEVLRVLYVVDRGTTGLSGDPTDHGSKLRKLLMEIGGSRKLAEVEKSGGSFGFGKAVYAGSSRIATIFAYSRTTNGEGQPISLLMGCTYHVGHEFDGQETTGRGFFARTEDVPQRGTRYDAYTGAEADAIAADLGMERDEGDLGTTIAIVDCLLPIEAIAEGVERSWWPRFLRDGFRVELRDETGRKIIPRPMVNPRIRPFWEAMDVALGKAPPKTGRSKLVPFNKIGSLTLGKLGLVVPQNVTQLIEDDDDADLEGHSAIAMVRSPGMVVWHHRKGRMGFPPVAGVFLADDDVDAILRRSEPPEHNRWDERAARLGTDEERNVVKAMKDRTWRAFRDFQVSAQPPKPSNGARTSELERMLSRLLGPSALKPPSGDGQKETPVSLRSSISARSERDGLVATGRVKLELAKKAKPQTVRLSLALRVIDEAGHMREHIPLKLVGGSGLTASEGQLAGAFPLEEDSALLFEVESQPYDRDWSVTFLPSVTPAEEGAEVGHE